MLLIAALSLALVEWDIEVNENRLDNRLGILVTFTQEENTVLMGCEDGADDHRFLFHSQTGMNGGPFKIVDYRVDGGDRQSFSAMGNDEAFTVTGDRSRTLTQAVLDAERSTEILVDGRQITIPTPTGRTRDQLRRSLNTCAGS